MNKKLVIIGAGGHGKVVADAAVQMKQWKDIVFLDDNFNSDRPFLDWQVLGSITKLNNSILPSEYDAVVAIGSNNMRSVLINRIKEMGFNLPIIHHPAAYISPYAELGYGSVVFAQVAINAGAKIGVGCIVNTSSTIDHDCQLGNFVHISPGAHLAGGTHVGNYSWLGIGSCSRQQIIIGHHCIIGAGAVVVRNVDDYQTVVGNPAKPLIVSKSH